MSNPWNHDEPWSVDNIWTVSQPIIEGITRRIWGDPSKKISGDPSQWWVDYICSTHLAHAFKSSRSEGKKSPESYRCLVIGSTELRVEKCLWDFGYVGEMVSADVADKALARCRAEAERMGKTKTAFVVADLNTDRLPGPFDFIVAGGVLHHLTNHEACLDMLRRELLPGGLLIAAEFTGPYRFQLPPTQTALINATLALMPAAMRNPPVPDRPAMEPLPVEEHWRRPFAPIAEKTLASIDPTEAISGHRLDDNLLAQFDVVERIPLGGTLTTYLHDWLDYRTTNNGPLRQWMETFVDVESRLIAVGLLNSDFTFYVLKNRARSLWPPYIRERAVALAGWRRRRPRRSPTTL